MRTSTFFHFLLEASLLTRGVLADLNYTAKMTHHGIEVPVIFTQMPSRDTPPKSASTSKVRRRGSVINTLNWAGAIQEAPSSGLFQSISAEWQVPEIYSPGPALTSDVYWLGQWVGIDDSCGDTTVILQAGTAQALNENGISNYVWWQWFPSGSQYVNMPINTNDAFFFNVTATSTESGSIFIENVSQGYTLEVGVSDGTTLCLQNAEWIVENPVASTMPTPKFDTFWFENCVATTTTGAKMGIDGTTLMFMDSSDGTVISSEEYDNTDMYVQY